MNGFPLRVDDVAVVTGGATGIGRALVEELLRRGLRVSVIDLSPMELEAGWPADRVLSIRTDIRDQNGVAEARRATLEAFGRVDLLCNNAGIAAPRAALWEQSAQDFERVVSVNLFGTAAMLRTFLPAMISQGSGHVLNVASYLALCSGGPGGGNAAYTASKHGVLGLSEVLAAELATLGIEIGVTVFCPGPVDTALIRAARQSAAGAGESSARLASGSTGQLPLLSPQEIAEKALQAVEEGRALEVSDVPTADCVREAVGMRLASILGGSPASV